jgi:hypothetical protein
MVVMAMAMVMERERERERDIMSHHIWAMEWEYLI